MDAVPSVTLGLGANVATQEGEQSPLSPAEQRLASIELQREALIAQRDATTDPKVRGRVRRLLLDLRYQEECHPWYPEERGPVFFGHATTPLYGMVAPTRAEPVQFQNHTYKATDPWVIAALRRMIALGHDPNLVEIVEGQQAFHTYEGMFLGWGTRGDVDVERWLAQKGLVRGF